MEMFTTITALLISAKQTEEESGFTRFLSRPVIAILVVIGCFIFTRISYAILRTTVRRIADSTHAVTPPIRGVGVKIVLFMSD